MTQQTKTPWFKASENDPAHPGIYLVKRRDGELWWRAFNGKDWFAGVKAGEAWYWIPSPSYEVMMRLRYFQRSRLYARHFEWCGLTTPDGSGTPV
jgi:hypothetical protein